eukprot:14039102-Ditylum_brightwellii.AAC.1
MRGEGNTAAAEGTEGEEREQVSQRADGTLDGSQDVMAMEELTLDGSADWLEKVDASTLDGHAVDGKTPMAIRFPFPLQLLSALGNPSDQMAGQGYNPAS